jgi:hypothetical protein
VAIGGRLSCSGGGRLRAVGGCRHCAAIGGYALAVHVEVSGDAVEIRLSGWEKALGLLGDIRVALKDVDDVQVLAEPLREVRRSGLMAGLRVPWLYYVARTIRLDEAWIVRRGVPALSFSVRGGGTLRRVVISTPEAETLARRLTGHVCG